MHSKKTVFIVTIILYLASAIEAQDIQLTSGNKSKTIKAGTFIEVALSGNGQEPCANCTNSVRGELISYVDGNLKLKGTQVREPLMDGETNVGYLVKYYKKKNTIPTLSATREEILSIVVKGKKKMKKRTTGSSIGMILTMFGAAHLVAAPVSELSENNSGSLLLGLGLAEMISGLVIGGMFPQKVYITSEACPQKKPDEKIWVLN